MIKSFAVLSSFVYEPNTIQSVRSTVVANPEDTSNLFAHGLLGTSFTATIERGGIGTGNENFLVGFFVCGVNGFLRRRDREPLLFGFFIVLEAEGIACWAGDAAGVVVEEVVEVVFVFGVFEAWGIRVGD